jgi:SAM-dependent methyltransferase
MSKSQAIRDRVSDAYTRAVKTPGGSCCGGEQKGVAAKLAGYRGEELSSLPADAVVNSFGCGNPLAFADLEEGEVVLDLGSGAGIDILLAAQKVGPTGRVIGVDMTDEMIARAEKSIAAAGLENVEVRKGMIEELPVESGSVDLVISNCVINLSPEKEKVFAEIARVLKPGGRMKVSDIVVEKLPRWLRAVPSVYNSCVGGAISEGDYLDGLRRAGLTEVEVTERLVYESCQLSDLALSEIPGLWTRVVRRLGLTLLVRRLARSLEGRIWSAKFSAKKAAVTDRSASAA